MLSEPRKALGRAVSIDAGRCEMAVEVPLSAFECCLGGGMASRQSGAGARLLPPGLTKSGLKVTICRLSALQTAQGCWFGDLAEWSKALPC